MPLDKPVHLGSLFGPPSIQFDGNSSAMSCGTLLDLHFIWNSLRSHLRGFGTTVPLNWRFFYDLAHFRFAADFGRSNPHQGAPPTLMLAASLLGGPPKTEDAATGMHSERSSGTVSTTVPATSSLTHHEARLYLDGPPAEDMRPCWTWVFVHCGNFRQVL